jgi:hypothetical protein
MPATIDLSQLTYTFEYYSVLIVCTLGFVTNFMNVHVSFKKEIQKTTMGFYNIFMSMSSVFGLIFIGFLTFFPQSIGTNLLTKSDISCRLIPYLARIFPQVNAWLNVMVSFDRVILMTYENRADYNNRSTHLKEKSKLIRIVLILFIVILTINIPGLFFHLTPQTSTIDPITNMTKVISPQCTATNLIIVLRDSIVVASRMALPLIIQLALSTFLIYKLLKLKINATTLSLKKEYTFTLTVVIFNIIFILSDIFTLVTTILINVYGYTQSFVSSVSNESAIASFVYVVSVMVYLFMYCDLLFFVNLCVHKRFRREARKMYIDWIKYRLS